MGDDRQLDVGFDARLFNNRNRGRRLFGKRTRSHFNNPSPAIRPVCSIMTNIGKVRFHGADLHVSSTNIQKQDFSWSTDFTYSYIMNEVLELPDNGYDRNRIDGITLADGSSFGGTAERMCTGSMDMWSTVYWKLTSGVQCDVRRKRQRFPVGGSQYDYR